MDVLDRVLSGETESHVAPFLWVRGEDPDVYLDEIAAMHGAGIREFCVEARPHPDFGGPGWWADLGIILEEAKARSMGVWLLDDSHFPTGFANGEVERSHPELRKRFLRLQTFDVMGPLRGAQQNLRFALTDPEASVLAVLAQRRNDCDGPLWRETTDLTPSLHSRPDALTGTPVTDPLGNPVGGDYGPCPVVDLDLGEGQWYLQILTVTYNGGEKETEGYLNPIDPAATRILIDAVYEPFYERFSDYFGTTFRGFFSDEPRFGNIHGSECSSIGRNPQMVLPWRDDLPGLLEECLASTTLAGADVTGLLPLLFFGDDEDAHVVRYAYMDLVSRLYAEHFDGVLCRWCSERGVEKIGHIIEDNQAVARLGYGAGHFFRAMAHSSMGGVDVVMEQLMPGYDSGLFRALHKPGWDMGFFTYVLGRLGGSQAHLEPGKGGRAMAEVFGAYGWGEGNRLCTWLVDHMLVRGINFFVPHGFSPAPFPDGDCPPHLFAHGHNPQWPEFGLLVSYTQRMATLLDGGRYDAPVALLFNAEAEWSGSWQPVQEPAAELARSQVEYDIVPLDLLTAASVDGDAPTVRLGVETFRCVVVPESEALPRAVLETLARVAASGVPVVWVGSRPRRVSEGGRPAPSLAGVGEAVPLVSLTEHLRGLGVAELVCSRSEPWLRTYHYRHDGLDLYWLVNEHPSRTVACDVTGFSSGFRYRYDPWENRLYEWDGDRLLLEGSGSCLVAVSAGRREAMAPTAPLAVAERMELGACEVSLAPMEGRCEVWSAWEALDAPCPISAIPGHEAFGGRIRYRFEVRLNRGQVAGGAAELSLAGVAEGARVTVNGADCGTRIVPPYRFRLDGLLVPGPNLIEVELNTTLGRPFGDFFGQFLPQEATGMDGATLSLGSRREARSEEVSR